MIKKIHIFISNRVGGILPPKGKGAIEASK